ncbi:MAG TPA: SBBP repeat-containing protein [Labilithrix sp.]|nr:SBBP repeat-containing protein [Labilithrix sp.]
MRRLWGVFCVVLWGCGFFAPFPDLAPDGDPRLADSSDASSHAPCVGDACDAGSDGWPAVCDGGDCAEVGEVRWAASVTSNATFEYGPAIATRPNGDIALAFSGYGSWKSGAQSLPDTGAGDVGLVFVKAGGEVVSSRRIDFGGVDYARSIAFDADGNVWIVGHTTAITGNTNAHALVRKVDSTGGSLVTAAVDVASTSSHLYCTSIAVGSGGDLALSCMGRGAVEYTKVGGVVASVTLEGNSDGIVARLDPATGRVVWLTRVGGEGYDTATHVAVDASGNVYLAGAFDSAELAFPALTRVGLRQNALVAKLNAADGSVAWAHAYGDTVEPPIKGPSDSESSSTVGAGAYAIAVDAFGHVAVGGRYRGTTDFGGDQRQGDLPGFFVLMLDAATGVRSWSKFGRGSVARGGYTADLAFDGAGHLAAVGSALGNGIAHIDGRPFPTFANSTAFAAKMSVEDGTVEWVRSVRGAAGSPFFEGVSAGFSANGTLVAGVQGTGIGSPFSVDLGDGNDITTTGLVSAVAWRP